MRVIVIGCEYSGVTTLIEGLMAWGDARGIHHHLDDHFTIPDSQNLKAEDAAVMLNLTPLLKEQLTHTGAHIVADSNIAEGGCVIKAGSSEIDASMGVRWRRVLEAIGIKAKEWLPNP